jgi:carbamoyltransferase
MGLAPYGRPTAMEAMRKIVRLQPGGRFELDLTYFRHHRERIAYQWTGGSPEFGDLFSPALEGLLGPRRNPTDPLEDRHHDIGQRWGARIAGCAAQMRLCHRARRFRCPRGSAHAAGK